MYNANRKKADDGNKEWAIIMPCGDKSLDRAIADENIAGNDREKIVGIATSLAKSLEHIHDKKLVHCDIKPRNFVRFSTKWKLIDLDAANRKKDLMTNQNKFSSGYISPVQARLLWKHRVGDIVFVRPGVTLDLFSVPLNEHQNQAMQDMKYEIQEVWTTPLNLEDAENTEPRDVGDVKVVVSSTNTAEENKDIKSYWLARDQIMTQDKTIVVDEAMDAWSFGVVLFNLCCGRQLFPDVRQVYNTSSNTNIEAFF